MAELLSNRLNPKKYPKKYVLNKTNECFINQSTNLLFYFLKHIGSSEKRPNIVADDIYREFLFHAGLSPPQPWQDYTLDSLYRLFQKCENEEFLDLLDLANQHLYDAYCENVNYPNYVDNLNEVFKKNGIGFSLVNGYSIPSFDQKVTEEITIPAFTILSQCGFNTAHEELMRAYESYRAGDNISSIISATNSFESVVNDILERKKITFKKEDKIINKMKNLFDCGLYPKYSESCVNSLISLLNAAGNVRNNDVAHAQTTKTEINDALIKFVLDSTASSILFMVRSFSK